MKRFYEKVSVLSIVSYNISDETPDQYNNKIFI